MGNQKPEHGKTFIHNRLGIEKSVKSPCTSPY